MQQGQSAHRATTDQHTPDEQRNIDVVREYMEISYTPGRASAAAVAHLCGPNNRFIAPSTFPDVHTLEEYAEDHGRIMEQVNDLHIVSFDVLFAKPTVSVCVTPPKAGTAANHTATSSRLAVRRAGRRRPFFRWRRANSSNSLRTGTSCRCGSSWVGRRASA